MKPKTNLSIEEAVAIHDLVVATQTALSNFFRSALHDESKNVIFNAMRDGRLFTNGGKITTVEPDNDHVPYVIDENKARHESYG